MNTSRSRFIFFATACYTLLSLAWIYLSDQLLLLTSNVDTMLWLSTAKGGFFVFASSAGFFLALGAVPAAPDRQASILESLVAGNIQSKRMQWLSYLFASLITLAMLLVRQNIAVNFESRPLLILFMLPIVLSAVIGGLGPGLLSTLIAAIGLKYLAIPQLHSVSFAASYDLIQWLILIANGIVVSLISETLRRSMVKIEINRNLLNAVVSGTSDAIFVKDMQGNYLLANASAAQITGKSSAEIIGNNDFFLFPDATARELMATDQAIIAAGQTQTHEEQIITHDGKELAFLVTKGPVYNPAGETVGLFGISRNISQRKQAEERLRLALEASSEGLWDWDLRTGNVFRSARYYELVGHGAGDELVDLEFFKSTVYAEDLPNVLTNIEEHRTGNSSKLDFECRMQTSTGELKWFGVRGKAVEHDADGVPLRIIGTITDISIRKQGEEIMRQQTENLAQRNAELERFNRAMIGRELDMIELKQQINGLSEKLGIPPPYSLDFVNQGINKPDVDDS